MENNTDIKKNLALNLRTILFKKGMKQKDLVEKTGVSQSTISAYCTGRIEPSYVVVCHIADVLEMSLDYLAGRVINTDETFQATYKDPFSETEQELLKNFYKLNNKGQAAALATIKGLTLNNEFKKFSNKNIKEKLA